ncbi:unnamed protein product, partial [Amoebophrya sp. A120]
QKTSIAIEQSSAAQNELCGRKVSSQGGGAGGATGDEVVVSSGIIVLDNSHGEPPDDPVDDKGDSSKKKPRKLLKRHRKVNGGSTWDLHERDDLLDLDHLPSSQKALRLDLEHKKTGTVNRIKSAQNRVNRSALRGDQKVTLSDVDFIEEQHHQATSAKKQKKQLQRS